MNEVKSFEEAIRENAPMYIRVKENIWDRAETYEQKKRGYEEYLKWILGHHEAK